MRIGEVLCSMVRASLKLFEPRSRCWAKLLWPGSGRGVFLSSLEAGEGAK